MIEAGHAHQETLDSHAHGLATAEFPLSTSEHRRRELWVHTRAGGDPRDHDRVRDDLVTVRGIALRDARAGAASSVFDGDLSTKTITVFDRPISPTRLERWATCPHAFFVQDVLGVRPIEEPSELVTIDARHRGTAIHEALHQLHQRVLDGRVPAPEPAGWSDEHLALLTELAGDQADRLETSGRTGRAAYWTTARGDLVADVREWVGHERAAWEGRRVLLSEARFGPDEDVRVTLPDGREIVVTGSIDRVDERPDGSLLVADHKTGKADRFRALATDPTLGAPTSSCRSTPLPRALTGRPDAPARAEYSFFRRGDFKRYGAPPGQDADLASGDDIDTLAAAHAAAEGIFGLEPTVAALARSALSAPVVEAVATGAEHWRELFVVADLGGTVLEGYVDLLVRTPEGLLIVDYKTDRFGDGDRSERIARYRYQLAAYGVALGRLLDEPIVGGVLVHCRPDAPAEQLEIENWEEALAAVAAAASSRAVQPFTSRNPTHNPSIPAT